jgi:DNA-binding response OmpR family regulator
VDGYLISGEGFRAPLKEDLQMQVAASARSKPELPAIALQPAAMILTPGTPAIIEFGCFRVVPHRRELFAHGRPINLGGRTFDVLMALIEGQGAVSARTR